MHRTVSRGWELAISEALAPSQPLIWHARRNDEMIAGLLCARSAGAELCSPRGAASSQAADALADPQMTPVIATSTFGVLSQARGPRYVMHGVDTDLYAPPADRAGICRSGSYPALRDRCLARVARQKGTDVFVEAMCRPAAAYPDSRLSSSEHRAGAARICRLTEATSRPPACHRASSSR